jgi:hypothetical protein
VAQRKTKMIFSEKKHCNRILFLLVMIVCLSSYPSLAWEGRTAQGPDNAGSQEYMSSNPTGEKVPWQSYVEMAGDKLGCYFTIEVLHSDDLNVPAESGQVMDNEEVSSVDALIAKVSREVKGIALLRNAKNPSIIQVMEEAHDFVLRHTRCAHLGGVTEAAAGCRTWRYT